MGLDERWAKLEEREKAERPWGQDDPLGGVMDERYPEPADRAARAPRSGGEAITSIQPVTRPGACTHKRQRSRCPLPWGITDIPKPR
jgi:hypothetical protein